jgi:membrane protease YdiL (CAAX protease family)
MVVWFVLIVVTIAVGRNSAGLETIKALAPHSGAEFICWVALSITAGFCEELVFRGYLQKQLFAFTGKIWLAVALQAMLFGFIHLYQSWRGAVSITVYGVLFGVLAVMRKSLRPGMIQHALQDSAVGVIIRLLSKHKLI